MAWYHPVTNRISSLISNLSGASARREAISNLIGDMKTNGRWDEYNRARKALKRGINASLMLHPDHIDKTKAILEHAGHVSDASSGKTNWGKIYGDRAVIIENLAGGPNTAAIYKNYAAFRDLTANRLSTGMIRIFTHGEAAPQMLANPKAVAIITNKFHLAFLKDILDAISSARTASIILASPKAIADFVGDHKSDKSHNAKEVLWKITDAEPDKLTVLVKNHEAVSILIGPTERINRISTLNMLLDRPNTPALLKKMEELKPFLDPNAHSGSREELLYGLLSAQGQIVLANLEKIGFISEQLGIEPETCLQLVANGRKGEQVLLAAEQIVAAIKIDQLSQTRSSREILGEYLSGSRKLAAVGQFTEKEIDPAKSGPAEKGHAA